MGLSRGPSGAKQLAAKRREIGFLTILEKRKETFSCVTSDVKLGLSCVKLQHLKISQKVKLGPSSGSRWSQEKGKTLTKIKMDPTKIKMDQIKIKTDQIKIKKG